MTAPTKTLAHEGTWPVTLVDKDNGTKETYYIEAGVYTETGFAMLMLCEFDEEKNELNVDMHVTTNVPGAFMLNPDADIIVNHNLSDDLYDALIETGLIEENNYTQVRSGMVMMPIHELTEEGFKWFASRPLVKEHHGLD